MSPIAHSKLTAQGQVSVPAAVRRRLGVGPGAVLEWSDDGGAIVVRRAGRHSSQDIHQALFPKRPPKRKTLEQLKEGIRRHSRKRHARR
jgi:AbrB family looped-hinge helix DNA binding protein